MKVDFHCHTKKVKSGDQETRNVTPERFKEAITNSSVKVVAITNHNHFDKEQYKILKEKLDGDCDIWPGVELNIDFEEGNDPHLILIGDPDEYEQFEQLVNNIIGKESVNNFKISIDDLYSKVSTFNLIYIAHFHDKKPNWTQSQLSKLTDKLEKDSKLHLLFIEPRDQRSRRFFINSSDESICNNVIFGSDVSDWSEYEQIELPILRVPIDSFKHFQMLSKREEVVIEELLNKKGFENIDITIEDDTIKLKIFDDINIIFGHRATGKTRILERLEDHYLKQGLVVSSYHLGKNEKKIEDYLVPTSVDFDLSKTKAESCEREIKNIYDWEEVLPTPMIDYLKFAETEGVASSVNRLKIAEATYNKSFDQVAIENASEIMNDSQSAFQKMLKMDFDGILSDEEQELFFNIFKKIIEKQREIWINEWINQKSIALAEKAIMNFKSLISNETGTLPKPNSTKFLEYVKSRVDLMANSKEILKQLKTKAITTNEPFGHLENQGQLEIKTVHAFYPYFDVKERFNKKNKGDLEKQYGNLNKISTKFSDENIYDIMANFRELYEKGINSVLSFLGVEKSICREDGTDYKLSSGEEEMFFLEKALNKNASVYIFDEPEKSLGNSYINNVIVPSLLGLASQSKKIIISTHNANIAVRTLPYASIYREHGNKEYKTYFGNPFTDYLVDICDAKNKKSWTKESMKSLEGGIDAFKERGDVYDAGKK